jgi:hypothetical protein
MAVEAEVGREFDAAEDEGTSVDEAVNIVAVANAEGGHGVKKRK